MQKGLPFCLTVLLQCLFFMILIVCALQSPRINLLCFPNVPVEHLHTAPNNQLSDEYMKHSISIAMIKKGSIIQYYLFLYFLCLKCKIELNIFEVQLGLNWRSERDLNSRYVSHVLLP